MATAVLGIVVTYASAAVSPEEAKQLGTTLTPFGAIVAGNKEGTIPPYTGGLTKPPANYTKAGIYVDPFPDDKPQYRIDASNWEEYKDKLTPGTVAMLQKYPKTFFLDVYPTRRSAAYPKTVLDNSVKNATRCALTSDGTGIDTSKGCGGGVPFAIPKTGQEVLWNRLARYLGAGVVRTSVYDYVKPSGEVVNTGVGDHFFAHPFSDPGSELADILYVSRLEYKGPTRLAGAVSLAFDSVKDSSRRAYSYQPSTRRVRLAPDFAADTPISASGGAQLYDDEMLFNGTPDRFEWKLIGKEERLIPYNSYRFSWPVAGAGCSPKEYETPFHFKADCMRWELHRVWHITGTLKEGKRHVYSKRDLYLDEDTLTTGTAENYDQAGKLYKFNLAPTTPMYDALIPGYADQIFIDMVSGIWAVNRTADVWLPYKLTPAMLAPDSAAAHILRK
ncbi:MAG TPA: DUF1329 domain-containing protein [Rubrivivax sp.]|nr:DUF1329 domain-containing protein [Rubrivivax sp.]